MEFKVGKWYKVDWWNEGACCKFSSRKDLGIFFTERIIGGNHSKEESSWSYNDREDTVKEVPLSEIQQYLPEGHEDKIKTSIFDGLIEGKYYRYKYASGSEAIAICRKSNTERVSWQIRKEETWISKESALGNAESVHPATQEEIEHLNACIAVGKYVDKPEKWIPKVGDWVTITTQYSFHKGDKTFKVGSFHKSDARSKEWFVCETSTDRGNGVFNDECRKALPHEIPKQEDKIRKFCEPITSNNLTPNKNEHTTYKGKAIEVRTVDRSISTGTRRSGKAVQGGIIEVQIGTRH